MAFCLFAAAGMLGSTARSDPSITGHRLLNWCRSEQASPLWMLCLGYIAGVADLLADDGRNEGYCPPQGLSDETKQAIVVNYLEENEDRRRRPALTLIVEGLRQVHPCS